MTREPPNIACASCGAPTQRESQSCAACEHTDLVLRPNDRLVTLSARLVIGFLLLVALTALVLWLAI
ncbi:MAG: hypothetical protein AAGH64_09245 [Planctomycetota bacterium]